MEIRHAETKDFMKPETEANNPQHESALPSATLLGCPFCGAKPTMSKGKKRTKDTTWAKAGEWFWMPEIKCKRCKLGKHGDSLDALIEWWNKRRPKGQTNDPSSPTRGPETP